MSDAKFSWKDPRFTYADVLTGARLLMVPYLDLRPGETAACTGCRDAAGHDWDRRGRWHHRPQNGAAARIQDLVVIPSRIGKVVGIIQFVYLAFLLAWQFWLKFAWAQTADYIIFAPLAAATVGATIEFARILSRLLRSRSPSA